MLHCNFDTVVSRDTSVCAWRCMRMHEETATMIPAGFEYHAPRSVADAVRLLGELGPDAKLLAGGPSLLPVMKLRFAQPSHLIDLGRIAGLRGITLTGHQ